MTKKSAKKSANCKNFIDWWNKVAQKKVKNIEKIWLKSNKPNKIDDDCGGDYWHVNKMMFDGEAYDMTYEIAEQVFYKGYKGEEWEMSMEDSLFCDLDDIINESYEFAKSIRIKK